MTYTMGGKIPVETKQKVVKLWLLGTTRKNIAEKVGIGEGTVTSVVQEAKEISSMSIYYMKLQRDTCDAIFAETTLPGGLK